MKTKEINTDNGYINITYDDNKIEKFQKIQDFFDVLIPADILLEKDEQKRRFMFAASKNSFSLVLKH
ncbi:MAG: hypothetical protein LBD84_05365 [Campylobacteraceae bacterium]|nr:hypothetical protein [Campylobacteraceae bacterium]